MNTQADPRTVVADETGFTFDGTRYDFSGDARLRTHEISEVLRTFGLVIGCERDHTGRNVYPENVYPVAPNPELSSDIDEDEWL